nr:MAG TPA: hypothetical protein [Microviridae sp.]
MGQITLAACRKETAREKTTRPTGLRSGAEC